LESKEALTNLFVMLESRWVEGLEHPKSRSLGSLETLDNDFDRDIFDLLRWWMLHPLSRLWWGYLNYMVWFGLGCYNLYRMLINEHEQFTWARPSILEFIFLN
jgi:hypothetical protein